MSEIKIKPNIKSYFVFITVLLCFVFIPALILSYAAYRYYHTDEERLIIDLKTYIQNISGELRRNISAEDYFYRLFQEYNINGVNNPNFNIDECILYCKKQKENYGNNIDFIVLTNEGEINYNSNPKIYNYSREDWYGSFQYYKFIEGITPKIKGNKNKGNIKALKKIFGEQITEDYFELHGIRHDCFIRADSSEKILPGLCYAFEWGGFFVFISRELLDDLAHLKFDILDYSSNHKYITGLCNFCDKDVSIWSNNELENLDEIKKALLEMESKDENFVETYNYNVCFQPLIKNTGVFTIINKKNTYFSLWFKIIIVLIIYSILSLPIIKYFWNTIILRIPGEASIKLKLAFLFFFATGIPLILCAVVSREYELYRKQTLIAESQIWSNKKLLGVEQRYKSFLKYICIDFDKIIAEWAKGLKGKELTNEYSQILSRKVTAYHDCDYICAGSSTQFVAAKFGLFRYKGSLDSMKFDLNNSIVLRDREHFYDWSPQKIDNYIDLKLRDYEIMNLITKKVCSDLNGTELPSLSLNKLELVGESLWQKSFSEILYDVISFMGKIEKWGFGVKSFMSYLKLISVSDPTKYDYLIILSWNPIIPQEKFILDITEKTNRNPLNFKLIAYNKYEKRFFPNKYKGNLELERFAKNAEAKPTEEQVILNIDGEDYLATSILGKNLDQYNLVGLYPIRNIELEINNQSSLLSILGFFCLILSLGLAQILTKSFVNPLLKLQEGALAIEKRNFKHHLSGLGSDEFGEIGKVFNKVMVGLEELEIAKIVQESLLPKNEFHQGKFSVYGKCVTMIDIGGDYLDFFKVDDKSFSILIGDVAGHGVGAAVIMAMAKAYILSAGDSLRSPAMVLNSLHKIILAAKNNKQRKIMTFQYMNINSETGENLYSNAGGCSPFIIRHSEQSVEEINMKGATLGAFKKSVYNEKALNLKPGDAFVLYTDGIVECLNKKGEMFGYNRLKKTLLDCWNENPEIYYDNIFKTYLDFVGQNAEARDDLSIVILMYNE